ADKALDRIAFVASDATHPAEVWVADVATGAQRRLAGLTDGYLHAVALSKPQRLQVRDDAGFSVDAWFVPALGVGGRAPTLLEIHGGPNALFGNTYFHEIQYLAARGYNVVFANPRGSLGYGYRFAAALNRSWGDPMFDDEMRVVDAVARRPDVDASRLGVLGGSYGGYATLWVVAHTDRFKGAIAERPVSNMGSSFIDSDEGGRNDPRFTWPDVWDDVGVWYAQSPITFIERVHTPLLLVHSDNDIRTPLADTLQEYNALKALGREVTYVDFPRENHDLSRTGEPIHRIERLHVLVDWLDSAVKGKR
ncbi:MAG: S9 family peptidase, partial [Candidatus Eremiobacteraeota bacterium]|nr:S9 family peptidase [Candidatus Eremiobacteraeota bacterium]